MQCRAGIITTQLQLGWGTAYHMCLQAYEAIKHELAKGGRAYIVCPLVDDSDTLEGVRTVENEFARLSKSGG